MVDWGWGGTGESVLLDGSVVFDVDISSSSSSSSSSSQLLMIGMKCQ